MLDRRENVAKMLVTINFRSIYHMYPIETVNHLQKDFKLHDYPTKNHNKLYEILRRAWLIDP